MQIRLRVEDRVPSPIPHEFEKIPAAAHSTPADTTEAVDALMKSLQHPAENEIQALRALILQVDPSIREGVKWIAPSFRMSEYFATTNLRTKVGVSVVLHFGAKVRNVGVGRESMKIRRNCSSGWRRIVPQQALPT